MISLQPIHTEHPDYLFVEQLLHYSFPPEERRNDECQRSNTDHEPLFECYLITEGSTAIGLVTVWKLNGFNYIEHLATSPELRNKGYGRQIMEQVKANFPGITILEVEPPENEMSKRRIGFYHRCGFELCEKEYLQPPYRQGEKPFRLCLMFRGSDSIDSLFEHIRNEIHQKVYKYFPNAPTNLSA